MLEHVLAPVLPLFGLIAAGYLAGRRRMLGEGATDALNRYVLFLALPAQLFLGLARITWAELDQGGFVATYGLGLFGTFAVALLLARRLLTQASQLRAAQLSLSHQSTPASQSRAAQLSRSHHKDRLCTSEQQYEDDQ